MRFELPEELEMLRSVVSDFAQSEVAPGAIERDAAERFDRSLFNQMAELGLTGVPIPETYGGADVGWLAYVIVLEELSKVCASTASVLSAHTAGAVWPLYRYGDEAVRTELLASLTSGNKLAGAGLSNSRTASLLGTHPLVLNAGIADGYLCITNHTSNEQREPIAVWLKNDAIEPSLSAAISKLGLGAFPTGELTLAIPISSSAAKVIAQGRRVRSLLRETRTLFALSSAAQSVGIAQGALDAAASYAKSRKQFGTMIGKQQGIMFKLSDMSIAVEASRLLVRQAAWLLDEGAKDAATQVQLARTYAARSATMAAREAVQIHGGCGYMEEYQVERMLRDAMTLETAVGIGGLVER
ncbi:alkylation response protein AidB-like acyl-CoA dehydrogenase [Paenibacillus cellulosilyticus]|uniref:Alkylation response protein AidB-like acyl-CoA dehydrogenase n=3 Tax=Paenibacillus cellulosilyticus TaxID=375489 RepID=A0A2V2YVY3_9BACL|nr:acyl-CoA dehydrogenase family protein [Paenibacillus cellulosilyticus]PWV95227.1 alkylation response protein AidB-like acyl-CoA dehydrogenase [Paenibacillus cellulosilyticus]QKS46025.1 acyl-CoA dehydrogenase family protein [Paenibacillus cellulosilyticus]